MQVNRNNFQSRDNYFWKVPISHMIQHHKKTQLYYELFSFQFTLEQIQLNNFCLWNCLWTPNAYRLVAQKEFMFQMLGETSIFTWHGKVQLRQKCQTDVFCGNMNNDVPPYISKFKFFIKNTYSTMTTCNHVGLV